MCCRDENVSTLSDMVLMVLPQNTYSIIKPIPRSANQNCPVIGVALLLLAEEALDGRFLSILRLRRSEESRYRYR